MTWRERNPDAYNAAWRRWYRDNAAKKIAWQHQRRVELRAWWNELKATCSCSRCGESDPACLQFHHVEPTLKEITISQAIVNGWSKPRILAEIAKCCVLCANCHLKHHWHERYEK